MWEQLRPRLDAMARELGHILSEVALLLGRLLMTLWEIVRPTVIFLLNVVAALILIFEEWGWRPLSDLLARLARYPLWAKLERFIAGLPPYGALLALAIPSAVLIPAKLLGVYFLTTGHLISAGIVIFFAKIASTALIARVFLLTKPALMQIGWFARAYEIFVPWKDRLFAWIRASWVWRYGRVVKWRVRNAVRERWMRLKPHADEVLRIVKARAVRFQHQIGVVWREGKERIARLRHDASRQLPPRDGG